MVSGATVELGRHARDVHPALRPGADDDAVLALLSVHSHLAPCPDVRSGTRCARICSYLCVYRVNRR